MERARAGDASAFKQLYYRHEARVYGYLMRLVKSEAAAADLAQEAFIRLWQARLEWKPVGSVGGYLIRICRRLAIDEQRRSQVRDEWSHGAAAGPSLTSPGPDIELARRDLEARLAAEIAALPDRTREVFSLKRDAGLSYREIAEMLGISTKTVDAHMAKALKRLRANLEDVR